MIKILTMIILISLFNVGLIGCIDFESENIINNNYYIKPKNNDTNNTINNDDTINKIEKLNNEIETDLIKIIYGNTCGSKSLKYSFRALIQENNSKYISYFWDFGDNTTSNIRNPTHVYKKNGNYIVKLSILDIEGEMTNTSREIYVFPKSKCPCS